MRLGTKGTTERRSGCGFWEPSRCPPHPSGSRAQAWCSPSPPGAPGGCQVTVLFVFLPNVHSLAWFPYKPVSSLPSYEHVDSSISVCAMM